MFVYNEVTSKVTSNDLRVKCLIISHAAGDVSHYQPGLLVRCLTFSQTCWSIETGNDIFFQVKSRWKRPDATLKDVSSLQQCILTEYYCLLRELYRTCMLGSFIQLHQARHLVCFKFRQPCLLVWCLSHSFVETVCYSF